MLNSEQHDPKVIFYHKCVNNIRSLIKVKPEHPRYDIANSCNGLLCLVNSASDPSCLNSLAWSQNPAWGSAVFAQIRSAYAYTMGVSYWRNVKTKIDYLISEWKNVAPPAPITPLKPHSPTYFCGALHWVFADKSDDLNLKVLSLDLDEEQFHFHGV
ncbi:hypothetical protein TIFTF001_030852 [Ficus carica]|uniref:Uncharacterized protein n=1 Tax=Ficus carica TaxID=3494 RepID=A0AA88DU31_FICCA|nr:hypothetical protein TIFTF001_030852 [Ficus carica]